MKVGLYVLNLCHENDQASRKKAFSVNNFWVLCRLKSFELQHEDSITC